MTTTIPSPIPDRQALFRGRGFSSLRLWSSRAGRQQGFTLVELMIGAALSSFILAGVLSTFLFLGRSGANAQNYSDMESQARKALELFAEDTRQAKSITWTDNVTITLSVNGVDITYAYGSGNFTRRDAATGVTTILVTGILAPVARTSETDTTCTPFFRAYNVAGGELTAIQYASPSAAALAAASSSTKQLQISLQASRTSQTVVAATNTVLSARFILRNKIVTA